MSWLVIIAGYLLGSIPTAYIAGRILKGEDIRRLGDENSGAANAYRELGGMVGITVGIIDAAKGFLAVLIAQICGFSQGIVLITGTATVIGHNWPVFIGLRGGRGESTTIGILLFLIPRPLLILAAPTILVLLWKRNVILASAVLFAPLWLVTWLMGAPVSLVLYSIGLPCLVGFTHLIRVKPGFLRQFRKQPPA
jgi:glycerol-3-phosphate acyltransferase PlsY